ncbi:MULTISPECIES: hypothetical protein [Plantibacter]|uniref:hypothetical protein n=1 Tax=Plantibacter TaxID=190323 RepID=UPI001376466F|nr:MULTISPECIES: hypothetical protein [Plantibacter]MBD8103805.1 hypothetical protein [Plantibacter sp. CFBP 8775]MBD8467253.1 hypothetical protein [Plantibacter sp. CFBP 8798]
MTTRPEPAAELNPHAHRAVRRDFELSRHDVPVIVALVAGTVLLNSTVGVIAALILLRTGFSLAGPWQLGVLVAAGLTTVLACALRLGSGIARRRGSEVS